MSDKKRLINDLRVIDLRAELEKRNLDKSGVRGVLIQRLSKYLEEEGCDPNTFMFDLAATDMKTMKRTRRSASTVDPESEEAPTAIDDMVVQDDACEDDDHDKSNSQETVKTDETPVADTKMDVVETENTKRKREIKDEAEEVVSKKPCVEKEAKAEDLKVENNIDTEDSINLDIGDDELLNEESDNTAKPNKKDEATTEKAADATDDAKPALADDEAASDPAPAEVQVKLEAPATSTEEENPEKEQKDDKDKEADAQQQQQASPPKDKKEENKEVGARNLWVSGLSGDTRAKDLKQLCSKHGKVIGAKVVTNARTPGSRCYGYVTMASPQDAENCIKNLHRTELHGRIISVEKAKAESESAARRQQAAARNERRHSKDHKEEPKENEVVVKETKDSAETNVTVKKEGETSGAESIRSTSRTREKSHRSDKDSKTRRSSRSRERRKSPREVLSFSKIWKERDAARARERSRAAREEERRRRAADALREVERRQRQEKHRLALEREKLRAEREKIEREKNELLRLERERHRLEREKLELERLELNRAHLRLEEERRRRGYDSGYRKASPIPEPAYERDRHKRPPPPSMSSGRSFEIPPPPRFDVASGYDRGSDKRDRERDYKRDYPRHVSSGNIKYSSNGGANEESRQPMPPGTRPKEPGRPYESRDSRPYRPSPPSKPDQRNWNPSTRYPDAAPPKGAGGGGSGAGEGWNNTEPRYSGYEPRYAPQYQPPPPGAPYPDRYAPTRDYPH